MKNFSKKTIKHLAYVAGEFSKRYRCIDICCGCYDSDYGCTMFSYDRSYACPFESLFPDNVHELIRMTNYYSNKSYKSRFDRKMRKKNKKSKKED